MFDEEKSRRKRKLVWAALAVVVLILIAFGVVYVNISNAANSALARSLNEFDLASVENATYPSIGASWVVVNIKFLMRNPTDYAVKINTIMLSFWVDDRDVGNLPVYDKLNLDLFPGEEAPFDFSWNETDEGILTSFHSQTYWLTVKGKITASVDYSVFGASRSRTIDFRREVIGIG
jgi:hypothetical protein